MLKFQSETLRWIERLRREDRQIIAASETARMRWLARVVVNVYPAILENEENFRRDCIKAGIAQTTRTRTPVILLRLLCGEIDDATAMRWADCIELGAKRLASCPAGDRVSFVADSIGGITLGHKAHRQNYPDLRRTERPQRGYWLTPPDLKERLQAEFPFDCDPCPHRRPPEYDGLTAQWGHCTLVNPPFLARDEAARSWSYCLGTARYRGA